MARKIAEAFVEISARTAKLEKGLNKSVASLKKFALTAGLAIAAVLAKKAFDFGERLVKDSIAADRALRKLSNQTGRSTKDLGALRNVVLLTGVSLRKLSIGQLKELEKVAARIGGKLNAVSLFNIENLTNSVDELSVAWRGFADQLTAFAGPTITKGIQDLTNVVGGLRLALEALNNSRVGLALAAIAGGPGGLGNLPLFATNFRQRELKLEQGEAGEAGETLKRPRSTVQTIQTATGAFKVGTSRAIVNKLDQVKNAIDNMADKVSNTIRDTAEEGGPR